MDNVSNVFHYITFAAFSHRSAGPSNVIELMQLPTLRSLVFCARLCVLFGIKRHLDCAFHARSMGLFTFAPVSITQSAKRTQRHNNLFFYSIIWGHNCVCIDCAPLFVWGDTQTRVIIFERSTGSKCHRSSDSQKCCSICLSRVSP